MKEKLKTIYVCTQCGEDSQRWLGRCPACGQWNTMVEDVVLEKPKESSLLARKKAGTPGRAGASQVLAQPLQLIDENQADNRIETGIKELDRVLGGGIVQGSVVLLGGEPGAGKSTLLLQLCGAIAAQHTVLYATGEESSRQIKLRAGRLGIQQQGVHVAAESNIDDICDLIEKSKPGFVVVDSIQTMYTTVLSSAPGSVSQVKECAARLLAVAKNCDIPVFIVGHVNKDGAIAGPKVMEHIVDTVMYIEGDRTLPYRILRAAKNRYGSTSEIGMFNMTGEGLVAIENPSEMLLKGRPVGVSGNCVGCIMEGTRPIMADIQALATKTGFGTPRRASSGFDSARLNLLLAVLEKRAGFFWGNLDVYVNVVGGLELSDTACDLPLCLSLISSLLDKAIPEQLLAFGEVGLGGEIRSVKHIDLRLQEAQRIGFTQAIVPKHSLQGLRMQDFKNMQVTGVNYLKDAIALI